MHIGCPKEIKIHEYRVGLTPASVRELTHYGHQVMVESNAGLAIGLEDGDYIAAGAEIGASAEEVFATTDLIVKVKEPQPDEICRLNDRHILFTYLHLAAEPKQASDLLDTGCSAIAYETVTDIYGGLPLLAPMSEVAGRFAIQAGAHALEMEQGGRGMLLGGVSGVAPAKVVIIGGGVVGANAARMAIGLEADVTIIDKSLHHLYELDEHFGAAVNTIYSTVSAIEEFVMEADLVIGGVLVPGASAPKLISEELVRRMKNGSVIVDVAIDQGGCVETSRPTSHADSTYRKHNVVHYCVTNIPGAVARTSTISLNNATLPFVMALADKGLRGALMSDKHLLAGLNIHNRTITHPAVAEALGRDFADPATALGSTTG